MYFEAARPAGTFSLFEVSGNSVNQKFQLADETRQILRLDPFLSGLYQFFIRINQFNWFWPV